MYSSIKQTLRLYWQAYGQSRAFFHSPYVHASLMLTIVLLPRWLTSEWWVLPIQVLPNMIGFTLGGYAILMAFGDERFRAAISGPDKDEPISPFLGISAIFMHFVLLQIIALIFSIVAASRPVGAFLDFFHLSGLRSFLANSMFYEFARGAFWFAGYFFFAYSLFTAIAAVLAVFSLASWFDSQQETTCEPSPRLSTKLREGILVRVQRRFCRPRSFES